VLKISTHHVIRKLELVLASIIILAALLASITHLLTPVLNEHRADFEKLASRLLQMPVMIRSVKVRWHGYSPEIALFNVTILDADTLKPKLNIQRFEIDFGIWRSLLERQVFVRNMTIAGMKLNITHGVMGDLQIGELASINIKDSLTGSSVETDKAFAWIFSQARLALEDIDINYTYADKPERHITLDSLALTNNGTHHTVDGRAILNQDLPIKMDLNVGWDGDPRKLQEAKGQFYVYFEGLELSQWFSKMSWENVQVKSGLASIKVWGSWNQDQWQKIQSQFQIYGLELYSDLQSRSQSLDRISGSVGWKREGNTQTISGEELYIDFPYHLWPSTNFTIKLFSDANGDLTLNALKFNYLNLNEALQVMTLADGVISESLRQKLLALNPIGELHDFHADADVGKDVTDFQNANAAMNFESLTLNSWEQFPGISNFKGSAVWNKTKGNLTLNSDHALLAFHQLFQKALYFDQISADVDAEQKANNEWTVAAKNILLSNADWSAATSFAIDIPENDSPHVDFTTTYKFNNIVHLNDYLPGKILDPDLAKWLQSAFKRGNAFTGRAVISGKMKDFPFEDPATGKFLVTAKLKDIDLNYAPGWPELDNVNGDLSFAGRAMTITILNGKISAIPLKNITAVIPFIGDAQPQILHVDGDIKSDLNQALDFIQASPLRDTVGKDLASINLHGPMQLKLGLIVPLRHPEKTTANGDVGMTNAVLTMPQWNIGYNNINGNFQFTEQSLSAKNISGVLFNVPTTLNITTLPASAKQVTQIRADIASSISLAALESWSKVPLSQFAQGSSAYQVQLLLTPHTGKSGGNELILNSDLKGIAVNLPAPYGKKATDASVFQLNIYSNETDILKTKLTFNKEISAAITLDTVNKNMKVESGEVKLGGGSANWQTSPGLVISGSIRELNYDKWNEYFASLGNNAAPVKDTKMLRAIDLSTNLFQIMGQQLHAARIQLTQSKDAWLLKLASNELTGAITMPFNLTSQAIDANFQRINVSTNIKSVKQSFDPRKIPAMNIASDDTRVDSIDLGHLHLDIQPTERGIRIMQLKLDDALWDLEATGEWSSVNGRFTSHLEGDIVSPKVSDLLIQWGVSSSNFIGSNGTVKFNLDWPDAPYSLGLKGLTGNISFDLGKGRIVELSDSSNAKIGLGRMLNIFSLSTLSRRLRLDFSDVTEKGYSFDYMKGDFALSQGSATTQNMRIEGPIARVDIKGRIGLVAKDFNMSLAITPYVTGSLPVLAAFAGGPIVGVAALVVDKVVSSGVSHVITYQYNITGPWTNPNWTPIKATQQNVTSQAGPRSGTRP
jgi:uncharacterized protein (TIGR02099 family)